MARLLHLSDGAFPVWMWYGVCGQYELHIAEVEVRGRVGGPRIAVLLGELGLAPVGR